MLGRRTYRGDTMIEVLLSVTIFSIVAVTGLTIMNQGSAASQRSLEITLVRNEMEAQAIALRYMYDAALAQKSSAGYDPAAVADTTTAAGRWQQVLNLRKSSATTFSGMVLASGVECFYPDPTSTRAFVINPRTAQLYTQADHPDHWDRADVFSRIRFAPATPAMQHPTAIESVRGLWVEAVEGPSSIVGGVVVPGYTDFHIRACWSTVGQSQPATLGTIVRLYEP